MDGLTLTELAVTVAVLAVLGLAASRLGLSAIPAYLLAGLLLGPNEPEVLSFIRPSEVTDFVAELGIIFLLFFLGEYLSIVLMCAMCSILFLGGWLPPLDIWPLNAIPGIFWFLIKIVFFFFMFAMVKAMVPRYRYDQLMRLGWKVFLPFSLIWVIVVAGALIYFGALPGLNNPEPQTMIGLR